MDLSSTALALEPACENRKEWKKAMTASYAAGTVLRVVIPKDALLMKADSCTPSLLRPGWLARPSYSRPGLYANSDLLATFA